MRLGGIPQGIVERVLARLGWLPTPLLETQIAYTLARTIMLGVRSGVFEVLAGGALSAEEVARRCGTHAAATRKLLAALAGAGYLRRAGERYALAGVARRWLLKGSPLSLRDKLLFQFREWELLTHYDAFLTSGRHIDIHATFSDEDWRLYQRGMRSLAAVSAAEVAWRTPVPRGAREMLDIGGSHGYYSVALCRRHRSLSSVILDLPAAVRHSGEILAAEGMGERVTHRAGDALRDDLGSRAWDVVFVAQLLHHFDESANRDLARRVARALRPGGVFVIQEMLRPPAPRAAGQVGALLDLYFAATSKAGTWALDEIAAWQRDAGLRPRKPIRLRSLPGSVQQTAVKAGGV